MVNTTRRANGGEKLQGPLLDTDLPGTGAGSRRLSDTVIDNVITHPKVTKDILDGHRADPRALRNPVFAAHSNHCRADAVRLIFYY